MQQYNWLAFAIGDIFDVVAAPVTCKLFTGVKRAGIIARKD